MWYSNFELFFLFVFLASLHLLVMCTIFVTPKKTKKKKKMMKRKLFIIDVRLVCSMRRVASKLHQTETFDGSLWTNDTHTYITHTLIYRLRTVSMCSCWRFQTFSKFIDRTNVLFSMQLYAAWVYETFFTFCSLLLCAVLLW